MGVPLALKIEGSPSTRNFKLCFKAKQHPWARDVGFYLGLFAEVRGGAAVNCFIDGVGLKDLSKIIHDAVFTACVILKSYRTWPICFLIGTCLCSKVEFNTKISFSSLAIEASIGNMGKIQFFKACSIFRWSNASFYSFWSQCWINRLI